MANDTTNRSWPAWAIQTLAALEADGVPVLVSEDEPETTPIPYERMTTVQAGRLR